jgi:hypothetical protein
MSQVKTTKEAMASLQSARESVTLEDETIIRNLGHDFSLVWNDENCPMELKKKIAHTIIEEVAVKTSDDPQKLRFVVYWKGGCHTEFSLPRPRPASQMKTSMEPLEIIRKMAQNYGDDQIAAVLNKSGLRTGKEKRWNQTKVATARRNYSIAGQKKAPNRPNVLTLSQAAKYCKVSQHTIQRLAKTGLLKNNQTVPNAPWEIMKTDIDSPRIKAVINHLKQTGILSTQGGHLVNQLSLEPINKGDDNGGYYD